MDTVVDVWIFVSFCDVELIQVYSIGFYGRISLRTVPYQPITNLLQHNGHISRNSFDCQAISQGVQAEDSVAEQVTHHVIQPCWLPNRPESSQGKFKRIMIHIKIITLSLTFPVEVDPNV